MRAGYLSSRASDRWNRSSWPMPCIGKTPVHLDCLVCLANCPVATSGKRALLLVRGRPWCAGGGRGWRSARSRQPGHGAVGQTPARHWRWSRWNG